MGSGIAQITAQSGFKTILFETNPDVLGKAKNNIQKSLAMLAEKKKIAAGEDEKIIQRIVFTGDLQVCRADIFIEAIVEKIDAKVSLFNQLAEFNPGKSVFASNTSSLSITKMAELIQGPERVIGMHFFNPATIMKLVEVVNTPSTNDTTTNLIIELTKALGKTPVICKDSPGFIVNRVARPYYIESLRLAEEHLADFNEIDSLMEASGFKLGPFRLMDLIGNDINYSVSCSVYEQMGNPERLRPSDIQKQKVESGELGRKTKKGYYSYE